METANPPNLAWLRRMRFSTWTPGLRPRSPCVPIDTLIPYSAGRRLTARILRPRYPSDSAAPRSGRGARRVSVGARGASGQAARARSSPGMCSERSGS